MSNLTFILGGARSGKSRLAQSLAIDRAGDAVLYVATLRETAEITGDAEMQARIARHRAQRPAEWKTIVAGDDAGGDILRAMRTPSNLAVPRLVLLDCLSMLISGTLFMSASTPPDVEDRAVEIVDGLLTAYHAAGCDWIIVSNEVGLSVVPENAVARAYRDALGRANQHLARYADDVYFMVAGLPLRLK
ncbi:MAG: bifunctional adenosylcobinamide kinase/adenosylcobinamide-phosphate guanylyltransferase [Anaerolineae bacterium]|nr:bifunctional adenosylcobinamide kinase/adenosylcobinamide-phosphate guanylyltransferase [Thermoflexales bacterium]MDW8407948.1 bifunctional adenosylcobinamide kinase/adenosylcobinamide-phosphate guanylyltransferase [Anaerolineae bacterium]